MAREGSRRKVGIRVCAVFSSRTLLTIFILPLAPTYDSAELLGTQVLDVGRRQTDGQQMLMEGDTMGKLGSRRSAEERE